MMWFRTVKASVEGILASAAAGQYRVLGYQEPGLSADNLSGVDRLVQVFYRRGQFPKSASGRGPFEHKVQMDLVLTVSAPAHADLTVLDSPTATSAQLAAALAAVSPAGKIADDSMDEFFELIYAAIMDGDQLDLGNPYKVANRWVDSFEKTDVLPRGEYVVIGGTAELSFKVSEEVPSTDKADLDFVSTDLSLQGDGVPKAGTEEVY